jgi:hypothetical protein
LTRAILDLAADPPALARYAAAARDRIHEGFTEADLRDTLQALYRRCLADAATRR